MKNLAIAITLIFATFLFSCQEDKSFVIDGQITDANELTVSLDRLEVGGNPNTLNNTKTDPSGNFSLKFPEKLVPGLYSLRIGAKNADFLLDGTEEKISIKGKLEDMTKNTYVVEGSPKTSEYQQIMQGYVTRKTTLHALTDQLQKEVDPLIGSAVAHKIFAKSPQLAPVYMNIANRLTEQYGDINYAQNVMAFAKGLDNAHKRMLAKEKIKVGAEAPEIAMKGPDGTVHRLSDLRGKLVLLDFWASWCGPCRKANPHVVELYKKYQEQGFEVFSVSLDGLDTRSKERLKSDQQIKMQMDRQKERWVRAIEQDNLLWDNHVSDLKKWESEAAQTYGVRQIPKTFLIGKDGNIVALNPQFNLEQAIVDNL